MNWSKIHVFFKYNLHMDFLVVLFGRGPLLGVSVNRESTVYVMLCQGQSSSLSKSVSIIVSYQV